MTTGAQMVAETRRHIDGPRSSNRNLLQTTLTADATSVVLTYGVESITEGATIGIGWEVMHVWAVTPATNTLTVTRGQDGSTAAAHTSGALVRVNPRVTDFAVAWALNQDLMDLSAPTNGLFRVGVADLTSSAVRHSLDLTGATNVLDLIDAREARPGPEEQWPVIEGARIVPSMDTDEFPSGFALMLPPSYFPGSQLRVRYRADYAPLTAPENDVQAITGLHASAHDIPPLGAAARLIGTQEVIRNDQTRQGDTRRAEEVPPGAVFNSTRGILGLRQQRISAEATRLMVKYGVTV